MRNHPFYKMWWQELSDEEAITLQQAVGQHFIEKLSKSLKSYLGVSYVLSVDL